MRFHVTVKEDVQRLTEVASLFQEVNLGATAIGTGINADPRYAPLVVEELAAISGHRAVTGAESDRGDLGHGRLRALLRSC